MSRRMKSRVNEALFFLIGPAIFPLKNRFLYGGKEDDSTYSGLRVLKCSSLNCVENCPCTVSLPGFVTISMRLLPGESYSAEYGFELIRISRIDVLGGIVPLLNPSV